MDFCFVGDEGQEGQEKNEGRKMTMSDVAPSKGESEFLARRAQAFLQEIGPDKGAMTLRSDQEPAMKTLLNEVSRHRAAKGGGRTVIEHRAVGDGQGNSVSSRGRSSRSKASSEWRGRGW